MKYVTKTFWISKRSQIPMEWSETTRVKVFTFDSRPERFGWLRRTQFPIDDGNRSISSFPQNKVKVMVVYTRLNLMVLQIKMMLLLFIIISLVNNVQSCGPRDTILYLTVLPALTQEAGMIIFYLNFIYYCSSLK